MQILGVYEDEGYLLHELGRFREARQANERLLPVARERLKAMGKLQQIRGVLTNIAQNCYELGDLKQAGAYLQERLQIAQAAQDHATVYDSYFQLMVLAHEQKQEPQARQWLARYEQYALNQKDSQQQTRARELLAELEQRNAGRPGK
jgi:tetratricopeptide (TPR) repeat protein